MLSDQTKKMDPLNVGDAETFNDQDSVFESDVNDNGLADDSYYAYEIELFEKKILDDEAFMDSLMDEYYEYVHYLSPVEDYWDALIDKSDADLKGW